MTSDTQKDVVDRKSLPEDSSLTRLRKHWIDYLAVAIASLAALFSGIQAKIASERETAELRAYVMVTTKDAPVYAVGSRSRWNIALINHGKTPAMRTSLVYRHWAGKSAKADAKAFVASLPKRSQDTSTTVVPPTTNPGDVWTSSFTDDNVTKETLEAIKSIDGALVVAGRVYYQDVFDNPHWTDFCFNVLVKGAIAQCDDLPLVLQ